LLGRCLGDLAETHIWVFFPDSVLAWEIKWRYTSGIFLTGLNMSASVSNKESQNSN